MRGHDPNQAPSPQQLAAYFDGELDAAARQRVTDWLVEHPDAAAELEAQRSLPETCQSTPPPEPTEAAWSSVLERINERTQNIKAKQRGRLGLPRRRFLSWRLGLGLAVAAAVVVAILLNQPFPSSKDVANGSPAHPEGPSTPPKSVAVLPVFSDAEVEIISMDAGDARSLVVGHSPMPRKFDLVGAGEVVVQKVVGPDGEVVKPNGMNMDPSSSHPMLWPLALGNKP